MKAKFLIELFALGLLLGCNNGGVGKIIVDDTDTIHLSGGWDALHYLLALEVVDQNGNNVLEGYQSYEIKGASAKTWHTEKGVFLDCQLVTGDINGVIYFILNVSGNEIVYIPNAVEDATLVSEIKCEEVFGDQEVRIIEAKWEKKKSYSIVCTSFSFEGVTYYLTPKIGYLSTARVVVNR